MNFLGAAGSAGTAGTAGAVGSTVVRNALFI